MMAAAPMGSLPVTVLVAAKNEAANIQKCLASLRPAQKVFVIDSHSTDDTRGLALAQGAEVIQFEYQGGFPKKRQWALDTLPIPTEWVLLVDADEEIPSALWQEIGSTIAQPAACDAYYIRKGFHFLDRRFRWGGFSFDAILLIRAGKARFEKLQEDPADALDMEVHERLFVDGRVGRLATPLIHNDFKTLEAYIARHNRYSTWEARLRARFLATGKWGNESVAARLFGTPQERRRFLKFIALRTPCEPWLWFLYHYVLRGGFLEGMPGYIASRIRSTYIADVRAKVYELSTRRRTTAH